MELQLSTTSSRIHDPLEYSLAKVAVTPSALFALTGIRYDPYRAKRRWCVSQMYEPMSRSALVRSLTALSTTVIPYWFRQHILRQKGKPGNTHSSSHYSFDAPMTLKGLLPPAFDEATHFRRSLAQLRSKNAPLEKYIVSAWCDAPSWKK